MNVQQNPPNPERIAILVAIGDPGIRPPTLRLGLQLLPISGVITAPGLRVTLNPCV